MFPLLHPQKLIGLCGLPGSVAEKEEAQFLLVVCSCVKQDPNLLQFVLEVTMPSFTRNAVVAQSSTCHFLWTSDLEVCVMSHDVTVIMSCYV